VPTLLDVSVNGHTLTECDPDGYQAWYADGYTQVQINVPPEKSKLADLFLVTCAYNGTEKRSYRWKPPEAVMKELKGK